MQLELAELIVDIIEAEGELASLYENYSGRGMYGDTTHAVATHVDMGYVVAAMFNGFGTQGFDEWLNEKAINLEYIGDIRSDSLGLGNIFY